MLSHAESTFFENGPIYPADSIAKSKRLVLDNQQLHCYTGRMRRIVLKNPTPVEQRYTAEQIHQLVCQHEKEWRSLAELKGMHHTRAASRVTGLAWFYYCGQYSVEQITKEFRVSEATMQELARVLGIKCIQHR